MCNACACHQEWEGKDLFFVIDLLTLYNCGLEHSIGMHTPCTNKQHYAAVTIRRVRLRSKNAWTGPHVV